MKNELDTVVADLKTMQADTLPELIARLDMAVEAERTDAAFTAIHNFEEGKQKGYDMAKSETTYASLPAPTPGENEEIAIKALKDILALIAEVPPNCLVGYVQKIKDIADIALFKTGNQVIC